MTEARSIEGARAEAPSIAEDVAHVRPAVERWLTWSGLIPLPAFLVLHLLRELSLSFVSNVTDVERAAPSWFAQTSALLLVWLPLAVHVGLAIFRRVRRRPPPPVRVDVAALPQQVSRASSWLSLLFVLHHGGGFALPAWRGDVSATDAGFRLLAELSSTTGGVPLGGATYLLGLAVTAAHAGLGVHRGLLLEGLLSSTERRRRSARACAVVAAASFCVGAAAVIRVASGVLLR